MRFFWSHYFLMPPLTKTDWAELGFREKDITPTPAPSDAPAVTASQTGIPRVLAVTMGPMPGTQKLNPESDHGYALYVGVIPQGGATLEQAASVKHYLMEPPVDGEPLKHYTFTRRRRFAAQAGCPCRLKRGVSRLFGADGHSPSRASITLRAT